MNNHSLAEWQEAVILLGLVFLSVMGNPRNQFPSLSLMYFCGDMTLEKLNEYFSHFWHVFNTRYQTDKLSAVEVIESFRTLLDSDTGKLKRDYSFLAYQEGESERWSIVLYRTQIGHLDFGVSERGEGAKVEDGVTAHLLVKQRLADVAICNKPSEKRSLFRRGPTTTISEIIGNVPGIYLRSKIDAIPSLHKKYRWEPFRSGEFDFMYVAETIKNILAASTSEDIVTLPFDDLTALRELVDECDAKLLSVISEDEMGKLLTKISLSTKEWLQADI